MAEDRDTPAGAHYVCVPCKRQQFAPLNTPCPSCDRIMIECDEPQDGAEFLSLPE